MNNLLQNTAFELYKAKDITVEEAYSLALDFLKVKKDKEGLNIVGGIVVSCEVVAIHGDRFSVRFLTTKNQRDFNIPPLQFSRIISTARLRDCVKKHTAEEVNKVLIQEGGIAENIEVVYYD